MKILNIIETAYRATLEEQDDTVVWLSHALRDAGADLDVLIQGSAVNYSVADQDASGFKVGSCVQSQPPVIYQDLKKLSEKGITVYLVEEDLVDRGIKIDMNLGWITPIRRTDLPGCLAKYNQVWYW